MVLYLVKYTPVILKFISLKLYHFVAMDFTACDRSLGTFWKAEVLDTLDGKPECVYTI